MGDFSWNLDPDDSGDAQAQASDSPSTAEAASEVTASEISEAPLTRRQLREREAAALAQHAGAESSLTDFFTPSHAVPTPEASNLEAPEPAAMQAAEPTASSRRAARNAASQQAIPVKKANAVKPKRSKAVKVERAPRGRKALKSGARPVSAAARTPRRRRSLFSKLFSIVFFSNR